MRAGWARWWSCERKRRYYGKLQAFKAARSATSRTGKPHRAYKCDYADHWHVTHTPERREQS
jgi:hypothetical protein